MFCFFQIYERYCAEDAAKEARRLAEEEEYEDVDEDENDSYGETQNGQSESQTRDGSNEENKSETVK